MRRMNASDLDAVLAIEMDVQAHPWTRGNFVDALHCGYVCMVYEQAGRISGYGVMMPAVDEMHVLNIGIAADSQRKGAGTVLLAELIRVARSLSMRRMILEVRPSNVPALGLYRRAGFTEFAVRRDYYPAQGGREDAVIMDYQL